MTPVLKATSGLGSGFRDFILWITSVQGQAIIAMGTGLLVTFALLAARAVLRRTLQRREAVGENWRLIALDLVNHLTKLFAVIAGLQVGVHIVDAPEGPRNAIRILFTLAAVIQVAVWAQIFVRHFIARMVTRHQGEPSTIASAVVLLRSLAGLVIWSVALLVFLDNLGVNITALVAGLGIGGVAIALAAQSTVSNFFSAFSIIMDKPFQRGDTIRFSGVTADVEEIGMRTTRLRSVDGHEIIISNSKLMDERIDNLRRMDERRTVVTIGVAYETSSATVREIPDILTAAVEQVESARFVRCHLASFGPSSLDYELVFFSRSRIYADFMATRQEVLFNVFEAFEARQIVIAYPTQTIYIARSGEADDKAA